MTKTHGDLTDLLQKHVILIFDGLEGNCKNITNSIENRNKNSEYMKELVEKPVDVDYKAVTDMYIKETETNSNEDN